MDDPKLENLCVSESADEEREDGDLLEPEMIVTDVVQDEIEFDASEKDNESPEELRKRTWFLLQAFQRLHICLNHTGPLSDEQIQALQVEFDESFEDTMEMINFTSIHKEKTNAEHPAIWERTRTKKEISGLKIMSWDLGMICYPYFGRRAEAIVNLISKECLDIVFLQELNPLVYRYIFSRLYDKYRIFEGRKLNGHCYNFNATLVRLETIKFVDNKIVYYSNTGEQRTLLKTMVRIGNAKLCLMNTHLESMLKNSKYRRQQLQKCYNIIQSLPGEYHVIFCGSLNIRDWEVKKLKMPKNLTDLWMKHGHSSNEYTWDLRVNKLIQIPSPANSSGKPTPQPRMRFGRMYFRSAKQNILEPASFNLIGKEIVAGNKYCVSDHWALTSTFVVHKQKEDNCMVPDQTTDEKRIRSLYDEEDGDLDGMTKVEHVKDNWDDSD